PMICGIGLDLCEVSRMGHAMQNEAFLRRYFTQAERDYIQSRGIACAESAAGHFAAKEAALKAFGTGICGMRLLDVEVTHDEHGAPQYVMHGAACIVLAKGHMLLSITHTQAMAAAMAIWEV
ncbi:MAG: holo-ACP synthase, partial [Clostridia bacterium]